MYKLQFKKDDKNHVLYSLGFYSLVNFVLIVCDNINNGSYSHVTLSFIPGAQVINYCTNRKKKNPFDAFRDSSEEIIFTLTDKVQDNYINETLMHYAELNTPLV
jgi:hypothetical protein